MANHYSALKRARQTEKKTTVNRANKSRMRTALRGLKTAISQGDQAAAENSYKEAASVLDKSAKKGVIHKNTASRYKSRLSARVKKVAAKA
jgi:small subunit ribosomal protein S20